MTTHHDPGGEANILQLEFVQVLRPGHAVVVAERRAVDSLEPARSQDGRPRQLINLSISPRHLAQPSNEQQKYPAHCGHHLSMNQVVGLRLYQPRAPASTLGAISQSGCVLGRATSYYILLKGYIDCWDSIWKVSVRSVS